MAAVLAFVLFLVLTGTGVSHAYWSTHATVRGSVQAASLESNCRNDAPGGVSVGTGPCLTAATTLTNVTSPGTSPRVGDTLEYTTTVANKGRGTSALTRFTGRLPEGLSFQSGSLRTTGTVQTDATGDDSAEYVQASRTFTARLGSGASATAGGAIAPAGSATFTLRGIVVAPNTGGQLTISYAEAVVTYADPLAPGWPMTVSPARVVSVIALEADLATSHGVYLASSGGTSSLRWTITVGNNGPAVAPGTIVQITLPAGLTSPSVTGVTSTCSTVSQAPTILDCAAGTVLVGESKSIVVTGTIASTPGGSTSMTLTATVRGELFDPHPSNNTAASTVTVASSGSTANVGP